MRRDPKREALRWLAQAERELKDAINVMKTESYYLTLFLCQQSAEKALKGFIYMNEEEPIMTHSVSSLIKIATGLDKDFVSVREAKRLDDYYILTRYPNGVPEEAPAEYYDDPKEAEKAIEMAKNIVNLVKMKIESQ
ncbi:TPA: HEPN domain-containing protein [bacterium]|jgi:HEPN domain-containing protein|nr:HEPN domain-containing protein [bacterium]